MSKTISDKTPPLRAEDACACEPPTAAAETPDLPDSDPQSAAPAEKRSRRDKNEELLRRAREGDREAADELVLSNLGLVKSIALRFRDRGTEYEDLVQIGTIGMLKAVKSFDFSYGTAFSTYCVPLVIGEIRRHLRDSGPIKISRGLKQNGMLLMREREKFIEKNGREPRISELASLCSLSVEECTDALEATQSIFSLNAPTGEEEGLTLEGMIPDKSDPIGAAEDRIALSEAINSLPQLQRKIILLRYYRNMSQQQTGDILGISQVKVSREEKKSLALLRKAL